MGVKLRMESAHARHWDRRPRLPSGHHPPGCRRRTPCSRAAGTRRGGVPRLRGIAGKSHRTGPAPRVRRTSHPAGGPGTNSGRVAGARLFRLRARCFTSRSMAAGYIGEFRGQRLAARTRSREVGRWCMADDGYREVRGPPPMPVHRSPWKFTKVHISPAPPTGWQFPPGTHVRALYR